MLLALKGCIRTCLICFPSDLISQMKPKSQFTTVPLFTQLLTPVSPVRPSAPCTHFLNVLNEWANKLFSTWGPQNMLTQYFKIVCIAIQIIYRFFAYYIVCGLNCLLHLQRKELRPKGVVTCSRSLWECVNRAWLKFRPSDCDSPGSKMETANWDCL